MKVPRIGVCLKTRNNQFWHDVEKGMRAASPQVQLFVKSPALVSDFRQQGAIVRSFKDSDLIILAPSHPEKLIPYIAEANRRNIPVLLIDSDIASSSVKYSFLGFNDFAGGYETGKLLLSELQANDAVAVIAGSPEGSYTKREEGFAKAVGKKLQLAIVYGNFEEHKAYRKTKELIGKQPKIKAIFCTSDNMALGCLTALYEVNREDVLVCGFDATHAGRLAVQKGRMLSTVNSNPELLGERAVKLALKLLRKGRVPEKTRYGVELLTKERMLAPKQIILKRKYHIVHARRDCAEADYNSLHLPECPVVIGQQSFLKELPPRLRLLNADTYIIISGKTVSRLYGRDLHAALENAGLKSRLVVYESGERNKTFSTLNELAARVLNEGVTKRSCIVVLGGGVTGNLAGFLAGILLRGVRFVHVPTTVLAQVDSSTGGKQAVNTPHGKNMLGMFSEPEFIYINYDFVKSLSSREYRAGMAEAVKHGLCQSKALLKTIEGREYSRIVPATIKLKVGVLEKDPREHHAALALMYGHTIGHALETLSGHKLNHGEAISIGMVVAARIAADLGYAKRELIRSHIDILKRQELPTRIPRYLHPQQIIDQLLYDKKLRKENIPFVLLAGVGKIVQGQRYTVEVDEETIRKALKASY